MTVASRRLVVKFGGSVLSTGQRIAEAARLVADAPAAEKLVVVSAPHGMTDRLVSLVDEVPDPIDPAERAGLVALGERVSARLLTAILRGQGVPVRLLEPENPDWPILTRGGSVEASLDVEASRLRTVALLPSILRTHVVVICGFLGKEEGRVTTLRRGGSDTTALALASFLGASDLVLVKDVPGIHSGDPGLVPDARPISEIGVAELAELGRCGSRVVAPEALGLLEDRTETRVIGFGTALLDGEGTRVRPGAPTERPLGRLGAGPESRAGSVTLVFEEWESAFRALRSALEEVRWFGLSATPNSLTVYLPQEEVETLVRTVHAGSEFKAVTSRLGLTVHAAPAERDPGSSPERVDPSSVLGKFEMDGRVRWVLAGDIAAPQVASHPEGR